MSNDRPNPTLDSAATPKRRGPVRRRPQPLALEARLMFDGAAVATAADAVTDAPAPLQQDSAAVDAPESLVTAAAVESGPITAREVVFVDSGVTNWLDLIGGMRDDVQVVVLDTSTDGLTQIAEVLQGLEGLDAIHIVSHGSSGTLQLAGSSYTADTLGASRAQLATIGAALAAHGDILLYGCDIGQDTGGQALLDTLAGLTGADVAASDDDSGSADAGGNWTLEKATGVIETHGLMVGDGAYSGLLALPGAHSATNSTGVFLGGNYIELGIRTNNNIGKFGADTSPGGAFTGRNGNSGIGMVGDADGFGSGAALNIDYFMPGSPEEGFYAGYKLGGTAYTGKNFAVTVENTSSGNTLSAVITGTLGGNLKVVQTITFDVNDKFFKNTVTLTNIGSSTLSDVRFMRSFDPDNTVDRGGSYSTTQSVDRSFAAGDNVAVVSATSAAGDSYSSASGGKQAKILYYSSDSRARVSFGTSGLAPSGIYDARVYDSAAAKGSTLTTDAYISIAMNAGTLTAGQSTTFVYYTSLDNRDLNTILSEIAAADNKAFQPINEDVPGNGQTVGTVFGAAVAITGVDNSHGSWQYSADGSSWTSLTGVSSSNALLLGTGYSLRFVPNADWSGSSSLSYKVWNGSGGTAGSIVDTAGSGNFSANAANATIAINPVNDAPVLGGTPSTLDYQEGQSARVIDAGITFSDVDMPANFNGGWLEVKITANGETADQLVVFNQGSAAGQIGLSGTTITYGGVAIGTRDLVYTGVNGAALRINLNTNATQAAVQALARAIAYYNTSSDPLEAARAVSFKVNDGGNTGGGGAAEGSKSATVTVTAYRPTELELDRDSATYVENDNSFYIDPGLTLTQHSDSTISGARVVIAGGFKPSEDVLSGTNQSGITFSYDAAKGVLTAAGVATVAEYQAALRSVIYRNTSENPDVTPRTITITLGNVVALTTADGKNHYYEVVSGSYSWTDAKALAEARTYQGLTGYLATITSQVENNFIREKLTADAWIGASDDYRYINAATGATTFASQSASEGKWYWVTGPEAGTLISTNNGTPVTPSGGYAYWNSGEPNNSGGNEHYGEIYSTGAAPGRWNDLSNSNLLSFVVEYSDLGGISLFSKSVTVTPQRVNDAPVASGAVTMAPVSEDAVNNSGALVSSFLSATDADGVTVPGIAITTLNSGDGRWQYSIDNGAIWVDIGTVSDTAALLLRTTDRVRFVPDGNNGGTVSLGYRAWDATDSGTAGSKHNVSTNGGSTAYSAGIQTVSLTVNPVNDAPVLTPASPVLTGISEDATANSGQSIATVLGSSVSDVDAGAVEGIAITALTSGNGHWEYNTGSGWVSVGVVSETSALLLRATDQIRFVPDGNNATRASFTYKAWDTTSGSAGSKVSAASGGGTSAFSLASDTASIVVSAANDAPVLSGAPLTFAGIDEDDTTNAGQTVGSLLGGTLTDVDSGAVGGIAIVDTGALGGGKWQYDTGSGWTDVPAVSESGALLLRATDKLRYLPDGYQGGTATLTLRGWDTTSGSPGTLADASTNGGSTAFSTATAIASIAVRELNDTPTISGAAADAAFTEAAAGTPATDGTATVVGAGITINDDGGYLLRAVVTIAAGFTPGDVLAVGSAGGLTVAYDAATGVLKLSGNASVATYQAALRSVTFLSTSEDPTQRSATRTLQWAVFDRDNVGNAAGANDTSTVTLTATEDAPTVNGVPAAWDYTEDDGARVLAPGLVLADLDDTRLSGATVTLSGGGDPLVEYLGIRGMSALAGDGSWSATDVLGSGIDATYTGGVLTLSGVASVEAYQRVMRTITYINGEDYTDSPLTTPEVGTRSIAWKVADANSDGAGVAESVVATTAVRLINADELPQVVDANAVRDYTEGTPLVLFADNLVPSDDSGAIVAATISITTGLSAGDTLAVEASPVADANGYSHTVSGNIITLSWAGLTATETAAGDDSSSEVQTIAGVPAPGAGEVFRLSVGGTVLSTDPLGTGADHAALAAALTAKAVEAGASFEVTAAGSDLVISWLTTGTVAELATLDSVATITADYVADTGRLTLSGGASELGYQSILRKVTFDSTSDDPTAAAATRQVQWRVIDSDGVPSAVTPASTTTVQLTAVNDAPTLTPEAVTPSYTENGPAIVANPGIVIGDPDDTRAGGATVSIGGAGFDASTEYLGFAGVVPDSGAFAAGSDWTVANVLGTGISAAFDAATGTLTLSGSASLADYEGLLQRVTYANSSDDPTAVASTRTLTWTVTDAFDSRLTDHPASNDSDPARETATATSTITLVARNDAPTVAGGPGSALTYTEGGAAVALTPAITLGDVDDGMLGEARVWVAAGFTAGDVLGATVGSTGIVASYDAGTGVLTLSKVGGASLADFQTVLRSVTFASTSADPTAIAAVRTISWQVTDGNAAGDGALASNIESCSVEITAVDTATVIAGLPSAGSVVFTENGSPVAVAPALTLSDADDTHLTGATVTLGGRVSGDLLRVGADLTGTGITVTAYDPATGVLTLSGHASVADYERALQSITFSSSSDNPASGGAVTRTLSWTVTGAGASLDGDADPSNDGDGGVASAPATSQVGITAINDAGTLSLSDNVMLDASTSVFEQGGAPVYLIGNGSAPGTVTYTDPDDAMLSGATVVISANYLSSDELSVNRPAGWGGSGNTYTLGGETITVSYSGGTLTLTGNASLAAYNTLLAHVQFANSSSAPNASAGSREFTWTLTDANASGSGARQTVATSYLGIRDRNDAPTVSGVTDVHYTEGDLAVALPSLTVADPDADEVITATLTLSDTSVGELSVPEGASYNLATGVWTVTGSVAEVNAALAAVRFRPTINNDIDASITYSIADGGEDDAVAASGTIVLQVTAVNDAPLLTPVNTVLTPITEDDTDHAGFVVGSVRGAATDVDSGTVFGIALTGLVDGNGKWQYALDDGAGGYGAWTDIGTVSEADALLLRDSDKLRFVPDGKNGTSVSFSYRAWDRSAGNAGERADATTNGNATAFSTASDSASLVVASLNDAPINDVAPLLDLTGGQRLDASLKHLGEVMGDTGIWYDVDDGGPTPWYRFQWQVADDASGANVRDIPGAINLSYVVSPDYVGKYVRLAVIATDGIDERTAYSNLVSITNHDPVTEHGLDDQLTMESVPITFTVPADTFSDEDATRGEDVLTFSAKLADGSPLPDWLTFDPLTLTFSGTPTGRDVGELSITVFASDGGNFPTSATFTLRVIALPQNPAVTPPAPTADPGLGNAGGVFLSPGDPGLGAHAAGDGGGAGAGAGGSGAGGLGGGGDSGGSLGSITGGLGGSGGIAGGGSYGLGGLGGVFGAFGGNGGPAGGFGVGNPVLAEALGGFGGGSAFDAGSFAGDSGVFGGASGTGAGDAGNGRGADDGGFSGVLTAPGEGAFRIVVTQSDQPSLMLFRGIADQRFTVSEGIDIKVPADAFTHTNPQAVVHLHAVLADDSALPEWLRFDPLTGRLVGRPPLDWEQELEVKIIARDGDGREAVATFRIVAGQKAVPGRAGLTEQLRLAARGSLAERMASAREAMRAQGRAA